jgi:hypothetical protein
VVEADPGCYIFKVRYTDTDNDPPGLIEVVIDNETYSMVVAGEIIDYTIGVVYECMVTNLTQDFKYYFRASDGEADAISTDGTPVDWETAKTMRVSRVPEREGAPRRPKVCYTLMVCYVVPVVCGIVAYMCIEWGVKRVRKS